MTDNDKRLHCRDRAAAIADIAVAALDKAKTAIADIDIDYWSDRPALTVTLTTENIDRFAEALAVIEKAKRDIKTLRGE
jgi:hypothetical protein